MHASVNCSAANVSDSIEVRRSEAARPAVRHLWGHCSMGLHCPKADRRHRPIVSTDPAVAVVPDPRLEIGAHRHPPMRAMTACDSGNKRDAPGSSSTSPRGHAASDRRRCAPAPSPRERTQARCAQCGVDHLVRAAKRGLSFRSQLNLARALLQLPAEQRRHLLPVRATGSLDHLSIGGFTAPGGTRAPDVVAWSGISVHKRQENEPSP